MDINEIQSTFEMNTIVDDASNVSTGNISNGGLIELRQTNVVKFDQKIESFAIDSRNIVKLHAICEKVSLQRFPWADVLLGIASIFAGAFISAFASGVSLEWSVRSVVFYILSPVLAVGCGVAYFFTRKIEEADVHELAEHIREYLPHAYEDKDGGANRES